MNSLFALAKQALGGLRVLLAATVLLGVAYPLAVTGVAQAVWPWQADGSLVTADGSRTTDPADAVGSALLGQQVTGPEAAGLFHPRPSAAGDGYDPLASAGSNLGPEDGRLTDAIEQRRAAIARREGVDPNAVPPDAVTASASGLDPHISPAYAAIQADRVARANGLDLAAVRGLIAENTAGRSAGVLGEARVNVLLLNIAIREAAH